MKKQTFNIAVKANSQITIVGQDRGTINAQRVESIISYSESSAQDIVLSAKQEGRYIPFMSESEKIKTILIMIDGRVYPSSFSIDTLKKRIRESTNNLGKIEEL